MAADDEAAGFGQGGRDPVRVCLDEGVIDEEAKLRGIKSYGEVCPLL
ncbi:MAG: hypothetical protein ACJAVK_003304 [Akkermansiaceae bacterium]|jgi:hypothetical protein